ncbi:hypothetical protein MsAg5_15710 [Methanosarcinaceae archaeon Ag5]|uniref:Uncharacterized protein n=1 Tax=Methanolapillus africanus TaxID=3028297 RepID=A0AAE4MJC9_9EURY|nr:hypothetical protein [Methanosarcinaceae archaeon Ag5]
MKYSTKSGDPYCYPDSTVLMNKFNITDLGHLQEIESEITYVKLAQLQKTPFKDKFDLRYL